MSARTELIYELASLVETATSVRAALMEWAFSTDDVVVERVGRRAHLGAGLNDVVHPLLSWPGGTLIARAIEAHCIHGGSLATTLRSVAAVTEQREQLIHESRLATATTKLSSRLLAGLAVTCLVLLLAWGGGSSGLTVTTVVIATVLVALGIAWTRKLRPQPPAFDHPAAASADLTASLLDAGLPLASALEIGFADDENVRRLLRLGTGWPRAIGRSSDHELRRIGRLLQRTSANGMPAAPALRHLAGSVRERQRREAEVAARRAPVLLVFPLTLCFLPAFCLVIVGPMIQALSG